MASVSKTFVATGAQLKKYVDDSMKSRYPITKYSHCGQCVGHPKRDSIEE